MATLIGGNRFLSFRLFYDAQIDADLTEMGYDFWHKYVLPGVEPPVDASAATTEYLKQKFKQNSDMLLDATPEQEAALARLKNVRDEISVLEGQEQGLKNQFMQWIGINAGIQGRCGRATWKRPNGSEVSWKSVAEAMGATPDVIDKFSKPMSRRFLPTYPKSK